MQKYNFYEKPQCILLFLAQICYKFFFKFVIFTIYTLNFMRILEFVKNLFDELTIITLSTHVYSSITAIHRIVESQTPPIHFKSFIISLSEASGRNCLKWASKRSNDSSGVRGHWQESFP